VNLQKLIFVLLLLPILVGCDSGFNIRTGKTNVAEARECYEAIRAVADVRKLKFEHPEGSIIHNSYNLALDAATNWLNVACKGINF
jgi:hypothetical protein